MHEIARFVFKRFEKGIFDSPHKLKVIVLNTDDKYQILSKKIHPDGSEQESYVSSNWGNYLDEAQYRDWLMQTTLQNCCTQPHPELPEITDQDREWMRFKIK